MEKPHDRVRSTQPAGAALDGEARAGGRGARLYADARGEDPGRASEACARRALQARAAGAALPNALCMRLDQLLIERDHPCAELREGVV